ncbi:hypothetical protein [Desulfocicer vacuolatum]|uniref:hypothetical protein n=1 Tax=Desulfocicer vacuolatum TaxID=2298 RepID=UPI001BAEBB3C|nr:hypothetical protein [Desulfocicer vacuolatum]
MKKFYLLPFFSMVMLMVCCTAAMASHPFYAKLKDKLITHLKHPEAKISLCYTLAQKPWTQFELPPGTDAIKIITTANMAKDAAYDKNTPIHYALAFEILDKENNILKSGVYHQHTAITLYGDPALGQGTTASYYFDHALIPGDGRVINLDLKGIPHTQNLKARFRLFRKDAIVSDVVMRLYFSETVGKAKLEHLWKRTGKAKKTKLARGNIYPTEFLTEAETKNLVRRAWRPLAPVGSEGIDYVTRRLYVLKEVEDIPVLPAARTRGIAMDEHLRVTLPIPEQGLDLKLSFFQAPDMMTPSFPPSITLKWFGKKQKTLEWNIPWKGADTHYIKHFSPGIMELSCDQGVSVLIHQIDKDPEVDITPSPSTLRVWPVDAATPLTYRISRGRGGAFTPFRASVRTQMTVFEPVDTRLDYTLLDTTGNVLKKKTVPLALTPSLYDRLVENGTPTILSDPLVFHFKLPPGVGYIQFSSPAPLLVNGHNRPPGMVKFTRVPEDYYPADDAQEKPRATWFPIRPLERDATVFPMASTVIHTRPRPPTINRDIIAGNFKWETFEPENNAKGYYLLVPSEQKTYRRDSALVSNFKPIALNRPVTVTFKAPAALRTMGPRLIFYGKNSSHPFEIKVILDGKTHHREALMGASGTLTLPPVSPGKHVMRIHSSKPVKVFINLIQSRDAGYFLRFAHPLTQRGIHLNYTKVSPGDETLSLALFFPGNNSQRLQFKVTIQAPGGGTEGPYDKLTLLARRYSVRSDNNGPVYVLNTSPPPLGSWQHCFIPLGSDLKPGNYTIKMMLEKGSRGYVVPYRVTPGEHPMRKLFREANHDL